MWRWSPLLQRVQLGLISGAEAAAQPNLLTPPGPVAARDWYPRVVESRPCIHPVLYCPCVCSWVVGEGKGWMGNEWQGQACCCLKGVSAMRSTLKNP